jgi:hypothetical protein
MVLGSIPSSESPMFSSLTQLNCHRVSFSYGLLAHLDFVVADSEGGPGLFAVEVD